MRFFKYLILIILSLFSVNTFADYGASALSGTYSSVSAACDAWRSQKSYFKTSTFGGDDISSLLCRARTASNDVGQMYQLQLSVVTNQCKSGDSAFLDGYITPPDGFAPDSVCHSGCTYTNESGGTAFDTPNGNLSWGFEAKKTGATCSTETPKGEDTPNGTGGDGGDGGTGGGGDNSGCTETAGVITCNGSSGGGGGAGGAGGGGGGSGGKGGDGGAGGKGGDGGKIELSMTAVVNAINSMSSSIVSKLTSVSSQITGAISQMSASVTDAIGVTNGKLDAVKAEIEQTTRAVNTNTQALNTVRNAIDSNTQAINEVKAAVHQQTKATQEVKAAVEENKLAINAVKTAVDAVKSSVDAVSNTIEKTAAATTTAINDSTRQITQALSATNQAITAGSNQVSSSVDKNTAAVNANGDKVTSAVNSNGKNTVDAINKNGENVTAAVNANTEETKKTNGLLDDLKEWLTGGQLPENPDDSVPTRELDSMSFSTELIKVNSAHCPAVRQINWTTPFGTINKEISFQDLCDQTAWFGYLVLAVAYFGAAQIVVRYS